MIILRMANFMFPLRSLRPAHFYVNSTFLFTASRMVEIHTLNFWCMNPAVVSLTQINQGPHPHHTNPHTHTDPHPHAC